MPAITNQSDEWPLTGRASTTFTRTFAYQTSGGAPITLSGYTAKFQMRRDPDSGDPAVLTSTPTIDANLGTVTLTLTAVQTAGLRGDYAYGIELTYTGGEPVIPFLYGTFTWLPEVVT